VCMKMLGSVLQVVHVQSPYNWSNAVNCKPDHGNGLCPPEMVKVQGNLW